MYRIQNSMFNVKLSLPICEIWYEIFQLFRIKFRRSLGS